MADRVMRMVQPSGPAIQRKCAHCAMDDDEDTELKRKDDGGGSAGIDTAPAARVAQRDGGTPMSPGLRAFFEPAFGHESGDFRGSRSPPVRTACGRPAQGRLRRAVDYLLGCGRWLQEIFGFTTR
jgi:hypothetical protein